VLRVHEPVPPESEEGLVFKPAGAGM
jgi:hypothetical protein